MNLDANNEYGIAALFVSGAQLANGAVFVVNTDGTGQLTVGPTTDPWLAFDPLPGRIVEEVFTLYGIADVVDWTPWLCYCTDGEWYARHDARHAWEPIVLVADGGHGYKPDTFELPAEE